MQYGSICADASDEALWVHIRTLGSALDQDVVAASFALIEPLAVTDQADMGGEEVSYGVHSRHKMDVYAPASSDCPPGPILLFVHGGGYASGDKRMGPFFANIGHWAASMGWVGATMNYRLAPEHKWPAAQEDIRDAVRWLGKHAAHLGGDPSRIILMGHSAGAGHCAGYAVGLEAPAEKGPDIAGLVLVSGVYDLALAGKFGRASRQLYYGIGSRNEMERSSLARLAELNIPLALFVAEFDPAELHAQAIAVVQARLSAGKPLPAFARLARHNHYTEILAAGLPCGRQLNQALFDFVSLDCAVGAKSARPVRD